LLSVPASANLDGGIAKERGREGMISEGGWETGGLFLDGKKVAKAGLRLLRTIQ